MAEDRKPFQHQVVDTIIIFRNCAWLLIQIRNSLSVPKRWTGRKPQTRVGYKDRLDRLEEWEHEQSTMQMERILERTNAGQNEPYRYREDGFYPCCGYTDFGKHTSRPCCLSINVSLKSESD